MKTILFMLTFLLIGPACDTTLSPNTNDAQSSPDRQDPTTPFTTFMRSFVTTTLVEKDDINRMNDDYYLSGIEDWSYDRTSGTLRDHVHTSNSMNATYGLAFSQSSNPRMVRTQFVDNFAFWVAGDIGMQFVRDATKPNHFRLEKFVAKKDGISADAHLINFSSSPDKSNMSFTITWTDTTNSNQTAVAMVFFTRYPQPRNEKPFFSADPRYRFMSSHSGKVFRLSPQKEVVFSLCVHPGMPDQLRRNVSASIATAVLKWKAAVGNKLAISYRGERTDCEPPGNVSSDYNIYVVPDVKTRGPGVAGATIAFDWFEKTVMQGCPYMFFFPQWSDTNWDREGGGLNGTNTARHEMGHVLGLAHEETAPSTMSHFRPAPDITDYDRNAINALY